MGPAYDKLDFSKASRERLRDVHSPSACFKNVEFQFNENLSSPGWKFQRWDPQRISYLHWRSLQAMIHGAESVATGGGQLPREKSRQRWNF